MDDSSTKNALRLLLLLSALFSFGLFVSSCMSAGQCFTSPCYEGDGLAMMWSVHDGEGFQLVVLSLLAIAHGVFSYSTVFRSFDAFKIGMLVAVTGILAICLFDQAIYYGVKGTMVKDLNDHLNGDQFYEHNKFCDSYNRTNPQDSCNHLGHSCTYVLISTDGLRAGCYRGMDVNTKARTRFEAVVAFSVLLALVHAVKCIFLLKYARSFENSPAFLSTASTGGLPSNNDSTYEPYGASPAQPSLSSQPVAQPKPQPVAEEPNQSSTYGSDEVSPVGDVQN